MSSHAGISACRGVSSASAGMTPSSFCRANVLLALRVPAVGELPRVLVGPLLAARGAARGSRPGAKYTKNGLSGISAFCVPDPADRVIGEVLGEVVALLGRRRRLDRGRAVVSAGSHWLFSPPMKP